VLNWHGVSVFGTGVGMQSLIETLNAQLVVDPDEIHSRDLLNIAISPHLFEQILRVCEHHRTKKASADASTQHVAGSDLETSTVTAA
jgi:hypothetical protein